MKSVQSKGKKQARFVLSSQPERTMKLNWNGRHESEGQATKTVSIAKAYPVTEQITETFEYSQAVGVCYENVSCFTSVAENVFCFLCFWQDE